MKIILIFLFCIFSFIFSPVLSFSEDFESQQPISSLNIRATSNVWQESIYDLKRSTQVLLDENKTLTDEKDRLTEEAISLQEQILQTKKDNAKLLQEPARLNPLIGVRQEKIGSISKELEGLRHEIILTEQSKNSLTQEISSLRERLKPWADQRTSLLERKTTLDLDVKTGSSSSEKEIEATKVSLEDLKKQLDDGTIRKTEANNSINQLRQDSGNFGKEIRQLKEQNKILASELSRKRKAIEQGNRAITALRDTGESDAFGDQRFNEMTKHKAELEAENKRLEGEIEKIRNDLEVQKISWESQDADREKLRQEVTDYIVNNKMLQAKITDFTSVIEMIKKENAMIEALLNAQ